MYEDFAEIYDRFQEIDYSRFIRFYNEIFNMNSVQPDSIIDLGCGTGAVAVLLAREGYSVTGIDISPDMLAIADAKSRAEGVSIDFYCCDMTELDVAFSADVVISALDCVNYLETDDDVRAMLDGVYSILSDGGLFIFDINSEYKLREILGNNTFIFEDAEAFCAWECACFPEDRVTEFNLSFFLRQEDGRYIRRSECQAEYYYSAEEVLGLAEDAGFASAAAYADFTFAEPDLKSERIFFVLKK